MAIESAQKVAGVKDPLCDPRKKTFLPNFHVPFYLIAEF